MGNLLNKLKEFLNSEEGKIAANSFAKELKEKHEFKISFFESDEFKNNLSTIKKLMVESNTYSISKETLFYGDNIFKKNINSDTFDHICDSIIECTEESSSIDNEDYPYYMHRYNEWILSIIHGQGTHIELSLDIKEHRNILIENITK